MLEPSPRPAAAEALAAHGYVPVAQSFVEGRYPGWLVIVAATHVAFTDDIYLRLVYEGEHIPLATLPGVRERTVSIDSRSTTCSVTAGASAG